MGKEIKEFLLLPISGSHIVNQEFTVPIRNEMLYSHLNHFLKALVSWSSTKHFRLHTIAEARENYFYLGWRRRGAKGAEVPQIKELLETEERGIVTVKVKIN